MAGEGTGVQIHGLRDLRARLKKLENAADLKEIRDALKRAADIVADEARKHVPVRTGTARDSIKATVSGAKAYVKGGGPDVPYYGWLDFGSRTPKTGQARAVGPWAHSGSGPFRGRYVYAALDAKQDEVYDIVDAGLAKFLHNEDLI